MLLFHTYNIILYVHAFLFCWHFSYRTCAFCKARSDWLQLPLAALHINRHRVTSKIRLTMPRVKMSRADRNPWLTKMPLQDSIFIMDIMGNWIIAFFIETTSIIEPTIFINGLSMVLYKVIIFYMDWKSNMAVSTGLNVDWDYICQIYSTDLPIISYLAPCSPIVELWMTWNISMVLWTLR